jgi:ribonuclease HI
VVAAPSPTDELATRGLQEAIDAYSLTTSPGSLSGRSPRQLG